MWCRIPESKGIQNDAKVPSLGPSSCVYKGLRIRASGVQFCGGNVEPQLLCMKELQFFCKRELCAGKQEGLAAW